ncbi:acyl-CoA:lysophosphatidylglycerol acyltransferase 1 [Camelus ferus]|nr:acyl-CoA:lysophosphatidylglycerol acyltransferase 1 [Camelus ferus]
MNSNLRMAVTLEEAPWLGWILVKALMRFAFMVANNLVAIPSYICYVIVLQPLRMLNMMEWGEDIKAISKDEAVMLVNHQATGDVCTLMMCLQDKGLDAVAECSGSRSSNYARIFPVKDVPLETDDLADWLYQRFIEKEDLLSHFYETGAFPPPNGRKEAVSRDMTLSNMWIFLIQSFAFLSGYMWYNIFRDLAGSWLAPSEELFPVVCSNAAVLSNSVRFVVKHALGGEAVSMGVFWYWNVFFRKTSSVQCRVYMR